jgi:hypothetical protein
MSCIRLSIDVVMYVDSERLHLSSTKYLVAFML